MSFALYLSQRTVDYLSHLRLGVFLLHAVCYSTIYIRYFESLDTVVGDIGHQVNIVNIELTVFLTFGIYLTEELNLSIVEVAAHLLYHPDVAEELGTQVSVAYYGLTNHAQVGVDKLNNLILGADFACCHLVQLVAQALKLALDDGLVDFLF